MPVLAASTPCTHTRSHCPSTQVSGVRPLNHGCVGLLRPAYPYPGLAPVNVLSTQATDEDRFGSGSAQCRRRCLVDSDCDYDCDRDYSYGYD